MKWESNSFLKELRGVASAILAGREFQRATTLFVKQCFRRFRRGLSWKIFREWPLVS